MILYHVTDNLDQPDVHRFVPRIPACAACDENKTIPRICMAPSIELCLQAMSCDSRCNCLSAGGMIKVYSGDFDENDLITPQELFENNYVPDALENQEYWVTRPVILSSRIYEVQDFEHEYDIAWTCVEKSTVAQILLELSGSENETYSMKDFIRETHSAEELYKKAIRYYTERNMWCKTDDLWEKIVEDPKAQKTTVEKLKLMERKTK